MQHDKRHATINTGDDSDVQRLLFPGAPGHTVHHML
jgi:hypothetical protein